MKKYLLTSLGLFLFLTNCVVDRATFHSVDKETVYEAKRPCDPTIIVKFKEDTEQNYQLIGTCEAVAGGGGMLDAQANNAMLELKKCACENGGDLIKIKDHKESRATSSVGGGVGDILNPNAPTSIRKDVLVAEIYIKLR